MHLIPNLTLDAQSAGAFDFGPAFADYVSVITLSSEQGNANVKIELGEKPILTACRVFQRRVTDAKFLKLDHQST